MMVVMMISGSLLTVGRAQVVGADPEPDRREPDPRRRQRPRRHPVPRRRRPQDAHQGARRADRAAPASSTSSRRSLAFAPVFALFAIIPVGPGIPLARDRRPAPRARAPVDPIALQVAAIDAGLLYIFAIASLAVYGTTLAGWASNNKLALLGGVRASSQMISYEVSLGLSLVGTMMAYRTLRLEEMVRRAGGRR